MTIDKMNNAVAIMQVPDLKLEFTDLDEYKQWRKVWAETYRVLTIKIRKNKIAFTNMQRELGGQHDTVKTAQRLLLGDRVIAYKLNSLLNEAKIRMRTISKIYSDMEIHEEQFPLILENCRNIDFHFNKKHLEYDFLPMWIVKAKGTSYYCRHVESHITWSTRETPDNPATKGAIRFKAGTLSISSDGVATIS